MDQTLYPVKNGDQLFDTQDHVLITVNEVRGQQTEGRNIGRVVSGEYEMRDALPELGTNISERIIHEPKDRIGAWGDESCRYWVKINP